MSEDKSMLYEKLRANWDAVEKLGLEPSAHRRVRF